MTQVTNKRRPVIDTLLDQVVARDVHFKRATQQIFDSISFVKTAILKYLEVEDNYLVEWEAIEMFSHEVAIQVTTPTETKNLLEGKRTANHYTITIPFEVLATHDVDTIAQYIDDMTDFDIDNIDDLELEDVEDLLDGCGTLKFEQVERRIVH